MASGSLMPVLEAQNRKEHPWNYESRGSSILMSSGVSFGTLTAPVTPNSFNLQDGPNEPFDFLETVVFIYVYIISADVRYVGLLHCVSSAALS